jgi:hypothetical protein
MAECTYIIDFASVVVIYRSICNPTKAGKESFGKRVKRVAGYFLFNLPLTRGRVEAEEVFHGSKIGGLHMPFKNSVPYSKLRRERAVLSGRHPPSSLHGAS